MIFVFKTSVKTKMQAKTLKPHIEKLLPTTKWNFDLEDIDKILRIEGDKSIIIKIIDTLNSLHFKCEELE